MRDKAKDEFLSSLPQLLESIFGLKARASRTQGQYDQTPWLESPRDPADNTNRAAVLLAEIFKATRIILTESHEQHDQPRATHCLPVTLFPVINLVAATFSHAHGPPIRLQPDPSRVLFPQAYCHADPAINARMGGMMVSSATRGNGLHRRSVSVPNAVRRRLARVFLL